MYKKVTVKIGSNVIASGPNALDLAHMTELVKQISNLREQGIEVVLVSSGAVAAGRSLITPHDKSDTLSERQLWASVGQVHLINTYTKLLEIYNITCAQVLVTKDDFRDRKHYLNLKNCIDTLLKHNILPIINENDAISVSELMFTDNDELSGMVAGISGSEALIILSNVDGVYDGAPSHPDTSVIREIEADEENLEEVVQTSKSSFGRGGMMTKLRIAKKIANTGIEVFIANGRTISIIEDIVSDPDSTMSTRFIHGEISSPVKKWLATAAGFEKGTIYINDGAKEALTSEEANSLLPIGILLVKGNFKKGDIVHIVDKEGIHIGIGKTSYSSANIKLKLGQQGQKPVVHYDYLHID